MATVVLDELMPDSETLTLTTHQKRRKKRTGRGMEWRGWALEGLYRAQKREEKRVKNSKLLLLVTNLQ